MSTVITRIAPSPTGYAHIGTLRMALYNYLFAKKHRGLFLMRIEDTDTKRNRPEYDADIEEQFSWVGLVPDTTVRQSENLAAHTAALHRLIDSGAAYISKEDSKDEPGKTVEVVRLRNPNKTVTFIDLVHGKISFDTTELKDFIIARNTESPLYHFAVVVDDGSMNISHVIRGDDHISNTPRQILIQEALGLPRPVYAHIPLNLAADRSKLSKRKGDVSVKVYRELGYLPHALLNYLAVIGWTPPDEREVLSLEEMVQAFDIEKVHRSASIFDIEKLRWYNRQYLKKMSDADFALAAMPILKEELASRSISASEDSLPSLLPTLRERIFVWNDLRELVQEGELDFFFQESDINLSLLPGKGSDAPTALKHLEAVEKMLQSADAEIFSEPERLKSVLWDYATKEGRGKVLWPLRYSLTGKERSPDPFIVSAMLGKLRSLERIRAAMSRLKKV